jgi:hypothetical protein
LKRRLPERQLALFLWVAGLSPGAIVNRLRKIINMIATRTNVALKTSFELKTTEKLGIL